MISPMVPLGSGRSLASTTRSSVPTIGRPGREEQLRLLRQGALMVRWQQAGQARRRLGHPVRLDELALEHLDCPPECVLGNG